MRTQMLIHGQWVRGEGDMYEVIDPATGASITQIHAASPAQIDAAAASSAIRHVMVAHA